MKMISGALSLNVCVLAERNGTCSICSVPRKVQEELKCIVMHGDVPLLAVMEMILADPYGTNPGPIDGSVLYDQDKHVSSAVWDGQERGALRCHEHTSKLDQWTLTEKQLKGGGEKQTLFTLMMEK